MNQHRADGSDWRRETGADLGQALANLSSLASTVSGELSREQARTLWLSYLLVEKSVAFVKLELDEENPGRFIDQKRYSVPDERQAIGFAMKHLQEAIDRFGANDLVSSLKELRESRNYLRVLLKSVRRHRTKRASQP
jgi:hypothetical protein